MTISTWKISLGWRGTPQNLYPSYLLVQWFLVLLFGQPSGRASLVPFLTPHFYDFILRELSNGFRIGFDSSLACQPGKQNMHSAYEYSEMVQKYQEKEVLFQHIFPLTTEKSAAEPRIQVSLFGVNPKRGKEDKCRLIVDLYTPSGRSVNDGVTQDVCPISYTSVDVAVKLIQSMAWEHSWLRWPKGDLMQYSSPPQQITISWRYNETV